MPFRFLTHDDFCSHRPFNYARGLFGEGLALFGDFGAGLGILGRSPLHPADSQEQDQREDGQRGDEGAGLGHFAIRSAATATSDSRRIQPLPKVPKVFRLR